MDVCAETAVIIPNWNGAAFLPDLLASFSHAGPRDGVDVVVVDNGSTDASIEVARTLAPAARLIQSPENAGFAAAVNRGLAATSGEYVVVLNNDTHWDNDWITPCVDFLKGAPEYAFAAPLILSAARPDCIDGAGDALNLRLMPHRRHGAQPLKDFPDQDRDLYAASGAAVVFRRAFFSEIGTFDEEFFMYYEDVDLFFRGLLRRKVGRLLPGLRLFHHEGGSIGRFESLPENRARHLTKTRLMVRNRCWLLLKNCPATYAAVFAPLLAYEWGRSLFFHLRRGEAGVFLAAHVEALRRLPGLWARRRAIQRNRSIALGEMVRRLREK